MQVWCEILHAMWIANSRIWDSDWEMCVVVCNGYVVSFVHVVACLEVVDVRELWLKVCVVGGRITCLDMVCWWNTVMCMCYDVFSGDYFGWIYAYLEVIDLHGFLVRIRGWQVEIRLARHVCHCALTVAYLWSIHLAFTLSTVTVLPYSIHMKDVSW